MMERYRYAWKCAQSFHAPIVELPSVSLLIAIRNEEDCLRQTLEALHHLRYNGPLEIILIDDHSSDDTVSMLNDLPDERMMVLSNQGHGKRAALQSGLQSARGEIILLTDADCLPGPDWVTSMVAPFADDQVQWVSGPVISLARRDLVSKYDALEWQGLLVLTGAGFSLGYPILAQGANIAFRQTTYNELEKLSTLSDRASGDDVFLLARFCKTYPQGCIFQADRNALVLTHAPATWVELFNQRLRWTSKSTHLHPVHGLMPMGLSFLMSLIFLVILFLFVFLSGTMALCLAVIFCIKLITDYRLLSIGWAFTGQVPGLLTYLVALFMHPLVVLSTGIIGPLRGRYIWKGRLVR